MTKARKATLEVLLGSERPLTASEIAGRIRIACNPVTIYRTLHYLEEQGLADSFVLHCSEHGTERYYVPLHAQDAQTPHHHWFHCERCHGFIDLGSCRIEPLLCGYQSQFGIKVTGHTLYLTGICGTCASTEDQRDSSIT
jgi:Fur family ferric uptake transcriptional regulator